MPNEPYDPLDEVVQGNVHYLHKSPPVMFNEWYVSDPNKADIKTLLKVVGYPKKKNYTFIITGRPDEISPRTKRDRQVGEIVTQALNVGSGDVKNALKNTPNEEYAAEEFVTFLNNEVVVWDDIVEIAIVDKD